MIIFFVALFFYFGDKVFLYYVLDACFNVRENKRTIMFFLFFLTLSFIGVVIVDSMIFSVSKKAESELKVNNENTITISFSKPINKDVIVDLFREDDVVLSFYKSMFLSVSNYPNSNIQKQVHGVDEYFFSDDEVEKKINFDGNVVIIDESEKIDNDKQVFIGSIPFYIVGTKKVKKTDFLDSLGLGNSAISYKYLIPINTAFKLSLNNNINKVDVVFNKKISNNDIVKVKGNIDKIKGVSYSITTFLDVKKTIDNVISRFNLLTNAIYVILNLLSIFFISSICKRNFHLRAKEFSLKIIHGIKPNKILTIVIIETIIIAICGFVLSVIFSMLAIYIISYFLDVDLDLRISMLAISFFIIFISSVFFNVIYGILFFKKNPVDIIRW